MRGKFVSKVHESISSLIWDPGRLCREEPAISISRVPHEKNLPKCRPRTHTEAQNWRYVSAKVGRERGSYSRKKFIVSQAENKAPRTDREVIGRVVGMRRIQGGRHWLRDTGGGWTVERKNSAPKQAARLVASELMSWARD